MMDWTHFWTMSKVSAAVGVVAAFLVIVVTSDATHLDPAIKSGLAAAIAGLAGVLFPKGE